MGLMMMIILVTVLVVTIEYHVFTPLLLSLRFLEVGKGPAP